MTLEGMAMILSYRRRSFDKSFRSFFFVFFFENLWLVKELHVLIFLRLKDFF